MQRFSFQRTNNSFTRFSENKYAILIILCVAFIIRFLFLLNTTQFENVSESGSIYNGLERLEKGDNLYLFEGNYSMALSYIAFFFKKITGHLFWFYVFQCLLSTLTIYFVYQIVIQVSNSKVSATLAAILALVYMDYVLLPSIAYNQTFEVFFTSAAILIIFKMLKHKSILYYLMYSSCLLVVIYLSLLFRGTLKYLYIILPIVAGYNLLAKEGSRSISLRLIITFIIFIICFTVFSPGKYFSNPENSGIVNNDFLFFGHTWYGGNGGEGSFVYENNKDNYNLALKEYLLKNNIKEPTIIDINNFQRAEIKESILKKPGSWLLLQTRKILYTYSIIPVRDTLSLLMTGRIRLGFILSALLSQITFIIPILLLFISLCSAKLKALFYNKKGFVLIMICGYLVAATSLYGHYQERYRIVVMVCTIIPIASIFFNLQFIRANIKNKRFLFWRAITILLLFLVWSFQMFEALVINKDRYFNAMELLK